MREPYITEHDRQGTMRSHGRASDVSRIEFAYPGREGDIGITFKQD